METKPFYKTSEFWLLALLQLLLWVGALPTAGAPSWLRTVIGAAGVIGYALARGVAKSGSGSPAGADVVHAIAAAIERAAASVVAEAPPAPAPAPAPTPTVAPAPAPDPGAPPTPSPRQATP